MLHALDAPQLRPRWAGSLRALPIIVGYHPGPHAGEALAWAVREADHLRLPLVVVYAADYPGMVSGAEEPGPTALDGGALEAAEEVTASAVAAAQQLRPRVDVRGLTRVTGPTRALVDASPDASMVVVGSRGRGPVLGAVLGSVSRTIAARAQCPVVVVPPGTGRREAGPGRCVTVGTDGSHVADRAVRHAAAVAVSRGAVLEILCCTGGTSPIPVSGPEAEDIVVAAERDLAGSHPDLAVFTRVLPCAPQAALVAASEHAGLVVVGSRGRGVLGEIVLGSVSAATIRDAACPVVVLGGRHRP